MQLIIQREGHMVANGKIILKLKGWPAAVTFPEEILSAVFLKPGT